MRLERLILQAFGRFRGRDLDLAPGLNVVFGQNEAGKSTVQRFIQGMLYGFWKPGVKRRIAGEQMELYRPWEGSAYRGALVYRLERTGQRIRVEREFGDGARVRVMDADTGRPLSFPQDERKELLFACAHLGLSDVDFLRTACVGQAELAVTGDADLANRLNNLRETGQERLSVRRVTDRLEVRRREVMQQLRPRRDELERAEVHLARLLQAREECLDGTARLRDLEKQLSGLRSRAASLARERDRARLHQVRAALARRRERARDHAALGARLAELAPFSGFPVHLEHELTALEARVAQLEEQRAQAAGAAGEAAAHAEEARAALAPLAPVAALSPGAGEDLAMWLRDWQGAQQELARRRSNLGSRRLDLARAEQDLAARGALGSAAEADAAFRRLTDQLARHGARTPDERRAALRRALAAARRRAARAPLLLGAAVVAAALAINLGARPHPAVWTAGAAALALGVLGAAAAMGARRQARALAAELAATDALAAEWDRLLRGAGARDAGEFPLRVREWADLAAAAARLRQELDLQEQEVASQQERGARAAAELEVLLAPMGALVGAGGLEARVAAGRERLREYAGALAAAQAAEAAAAGAVARVAGLEGQLAGARGALAGLLAQAGVAEAVAFRDGCAARRRYDDLARERESLQRLLDQDLAGGDPARWEAEAADLAARLEVAAAAEPPEPGDPAAWEEALAGARAELQGAEQEAARLRGSLERACGDTAGLNAAVLAAQELRAAVAALEDEKAALELARDHLQAAAEDLHREFAPRLNAALARVLPELTGGRYAGAAVDERLAVRVDVLDGALRVPSEQLSAGTRDQLYLALRVALLELLVPPDAEPPPLLLDDPFVQWDGARLQGALGLVVRLARRHQVLLFTCHAREVEAACAAGPAHVVELA